jgi:hypothetical protein
MLIIQQYIITIFYFLYKIINSLRHNTIETGQFHIYMENKSINFYIPARLHFKPNFVKGREDVYLPLLIGIDVSK